MSCPVIGRSQGKSILIAMGKLQMGYKETAIVAWKPICRRPGDTTGGVVTDLPEEFRTDARAQFSMGLIHNSRISVRTDLKFRLKKNGSIIESKSDCSR